MEEKNKFKKWIPILVAACVSFTLRMAMVSQENEKQRAQESFNNSHAHLEEEIVAANIANSNELLGVFKLEGDSTNINLIGPDGTIIKSGVDDYVNSIGSTEKGVYVEFEGVFMNTQTGEYTTEYRVLMDISVNGVEDVRCYRYTEEIDGKTYFNVITDDKNYRTEVDGKYVITDIVNGWNNDKPVGEIKIENDELIVRLYEDGDNGEN